MLRYVSHGFKRSEVIIWCFDHLIMLFFIFDVNVVLRY